MDDFFLLNCRRCHQQLRICGSCYRRHELCRPCARVARRESCREYERTYRMSLAGKLGNARRQADLRDRRRKARAAAQVVTHHDRPTEPDGRQASLPIAAPSTTGPAALASQPPAAVSTSASAPAAQLEVKTDALHVLVPEPARLERCSFCRRPLGRYARRPDRAARRGARPRLVWRH